LDPLTLTPESPAPSPANAKNIQYLTGEPQISTETLRLPQRALPRSQIESRISTCPHHPLPLASPLLAPRSGLTLVPNNRVQLNPRRIIRAIRGIPLAPIIAHRVGKDVAVTGESGSGDGATDLGVALEAVLSVLVPEVECAVGAGGAEGTVLWVEGYGVDGVDLGDVARGGVLLAVAFEGEVEARQSELLANVSCGVSGDLGDGVGEAYLVC
jgi:hypothetical protein